jgi:uncharacterized membrane protein
MKNNYKSFLTYDEKKIIEKEITAAESKTSGEIRIHILKNEKIKDIMKEAEKWFKKLKMNKTRDRNGVLLIIAPAAKKFAIFGDIEINNKIKDNFWDIIRDKIQMSFKESKYVEGIKLSIKETGDLLAKYFPIKADDTNELSNEITES